MLRAVIVLILACSWTEGVAQARMNEAAAKEAVYRVVRHSGLLPNFTVREDPQVHSAVAYIKGHDRVIAYNPSFLSQLLDSARTDLAAVSILAHEIAHHLLGHTLEPDAVRPGDELACDRYSGFILQRMGADLGATLAAMQLAGDVHGTERHPPRHARLAAIEQGWHEALRLARGDGPEEFHVDRPFRQVVRMAGDANTYYVDADGRLVWFNAHAEPIEFGTCEELPKGEFRYALTWQGQRFHVDTRYAIWRLAEHGMPLQVGRMEPYERGVR
ncbi:MAG: M48 family metalloprotease [Flavobacteriales bacterium]|nr:M48 family metalloprotease [Flavobacteriales bacterium]